MTPLLLELPLNSFYAFYHDTKSWGAGDSLTVFRGDIWTLGVSLTERGVKLFAGEYDERGRPFTDMLGYDINDVPIEEALKTLEERWKL